MLLVEDVGVEGCVLYPHFLPSREEKCVDGEEVSVIFQFSLPM